MKMKTVTIEIPFSGFYNSSHDEMMDAVVEREGVDYDAIDYKKFRELYAKEYVDSFQAWIDEEFERPLPLTTLKFKELISPREYNFTTDRIFCEISLEEVKALFDLCQLKTFSEVCREKFTSRSGFISFYNPNWDRWGSIETWDQNQLGLIFDAILKHENIELDDYEIMGNVCCNGKIENMLYQCIKEKEKNNA